MCGGCVLSTDGDGSGDDDLCEIIRPTLTADERKSCALQKTREKQQRYRDKLKRDAAAAADARDQSAPGPSTTSDAPAPSSKAFLFI